jgi:hypothetical protein
LEIIRKNNARWARHVYRPYCADWTEAQFAEAAVLVSGIEYAILMPTELPVSLESRITGAIHSILGIYQVPEPVRREQATQVLARDYRSLGRTVLQNFKNHVEAMTKSSNNI